MPIKPYPLPDPRTRPDSFLTILYKTMKCIEFDDRAWDKIYFARSNKRMMQLLETFEGDVQTAAKCMQELKDKFESDGLSWTIETILQYSFEWKAEHARKTDRECMKRLFGTYGDSMGLQKIEPGDVLKKLLALPEPPAKEPGQP
jgi:hypothetical protein